MTTFTEYTKKFAVDIGQDPNTLLPEAKRLIPLQVWDEPLEYYPRTFSLFVDRLFEHFLG